VAVAVVVVAAGVGEEAEEAAVAVVEATAIMAAAAATAAPRAKHEMWSRARMTEKNRRKRARKTWKRIGMNQRAGTVA
jgi:hypothetical protein